MQNNAVLQRGTQRAAVIQGWLTAKSAQLGTWLSGPSKFFTLIAGFKVTHRQVLATTAGTVLAVVAMAVAEYNLMVSAAAAVSLLWLTTKGKKGGRA